MMKMRVKRKELSSFAPLFVFALFALSVIAVLLSGAKIYKENNRRDSSSYDRVTVSQYIATRIRQSDRADACFVGDFAGNESQEGDTLFYRETIDGEEYLTRIYCYNGYLYELFSLAEDEFEPRDGEPIIPVHSLNFRRSNGYVEVDIEYSDRSNATLFFTLRSDAEVAE